MAGKKHYITDPTAGIRPINVIRNFPSCQLNDEEFVKEFFERFNANALLIAYFDQNNEVQCLGRLKRGSMAFRFYRILSSRFEQVFQRTIKEME